MSNLNIAFRQNASSLNDGIPATKQYVYVRNLALINKRFKLIASNDKVLKLPSQEAIAEVNNPNVISSTGDSYKYLETCIQPYLISSDFELTFINNRILNKFNANTPEPNMRMAFRAVPPNPVGNAALSKIIVATENQALGPNETQYDSIIYFDYSEGITLYQSYIIGIAKNKIDRAIELDRDIDTPVVSITDNRTNSVREYSINDILEKALLDGSYYYISYEIPNENAVIPLTITSGLDAENLYFNNVTKHVSIMVTKNTVSPYTVFELDEFEKGATPLSRDISISTIPSRAYGNFKYIQFKQVAEDDVIEVLLRYTNNTNNHTFTNLIPLHGTINDESFIVLVKQGTYGTGVELTYRLRNATLLLQFNKPLATTDNVYFNAFKVKPNEVGMSYVPSAVGVKYNEGIRSGHNFYITEHGIDIGQAVLIQQGSFFITNATNAYDIEITDGYGYEGYYARPVIDVLRNNAIAYDVLSEFKNFNDEIIKPFPNGEYLDTNHANVFIIERILGGIRLHYFSNHTPGPASFEYHLGYYELKLDRFADNDKLHFLGTGGMKISAPLTTGVDYDLTLVNPSNIPLDIVTTNTNIISDIGE